MVSRGPGTHDGTIRRHLASGLLVCLAAVACSDQGRLEAGAGAAVLTAAPASADTPLPPGAVQAAIGALLDADPGSHRSGGRRTARERADLIALYEPGGRTPLWTDAAGRPGRQAREAVSLLAAAADDGLDPGAYGSAWLAARLAALAAVHGPDARAVEVAEFDEALSAAMLRYVRHLHLGRVDPRTIGLQMVVPVEQHDFVVVLREAIETGTVAALHAQMTPPLLQYRALRDVLPRYRALAARADLAEILVPAASVKPGEAYDGLDALHAHLTMLGDLPSETPGPAAHGTYDDVLAEGVRRFQRRHGLEADGVIGKATIAALRVPLTQRARQIELALERFRWLPDLDDRRLIGLNIPMFRLWAWNTAPGGAPSFDMRAVVGRALSSQTPVFVADLTQVVFRPYWNVPRSILRNELLPEIARDLDYLRRHDMEMVRGWGDRAPVMEPTPDNVALLRAGTLRLRQRPGPRNALGLVKFDFPNVSDVYMHGTPAQELFSRTRRDFSHGCVRVEDPAALAEWVLQEQPDWTRDRIEAAMAGPHTAYVPLARPIRVVLFYTTAAVMPEDGAVHFADDIYGHDGRLAAALGRP
jgi:L,D-transpeptidase YcbB